MFRQRNSRSHRSRAIRSPSSSATPGFEALEPRTMMSATSWTEAYAWYIVNEMRSDPAGFADELEGLYNGTIAEAHGYTPDDPVWTDIRNMIDNSRNPQHFQEALDLLRAQPALGPLGLEDRLAVVADEHNDWMQTHCYSHSYYEGSSTYPECSATLPRANQPYVVQPGIGGDYDVVSESRLGGWSTGSWAENISLTPANSLGSLPATRAEIPQEYWGTFPHLQRLAYTDIIGFITEVNSDSLGHLRNLLSRDRSDSGLSLAGNKNKDIGSNNAIGIGYTIWDAYGSGQTHMISTHTLSEYRYQLEPGAPREGGYIAGVAYLDWIENDHYDMNEGINIEWLICGNGLCLGGSMIGDSYGVISEFIPVNGEYTISARAADGTNLGSRTVFINNNNAWVEFEYPDGFGLTGGTTPTLAPDLYEVGNGNDTSALALNLGVVSPASEFGRRTDVLSIHESGDEDWFVFDVVGRDADARIEAGFEHDQGDIDMRLYDANLNQLGSSLSVTDNELITDQLAPGRYYIRVYGYSGATNFYMLTANIESVPSQDVVGDTLAAASILTFDSAGNASFDSLLEQDDIDLYRFVLDQPGQISARTSLPAGGMVEADTYLRLFDASGNELAADDDSGDGLYSELQSELDSGTWYIGVSGFGNDIYSPVDGSQSQSDMLGDYRLAVAVAFADDHADGPAVGATPVGMDKGAAHGILESIGDRDAFTFVIDEAGQVTIDLRESASGVDTYLRLYNAEGIMVSENDDSGGAYNSQIVQQLDVGTWYLTAGARNDTGTGAYELTIQHRAGYQPGQHHVFSNNTQVSISPEGMSAVYTPIDVSGLAGTVTDINVQLDITHTWVSDLRPVLVAPDETRIQLANRLGGSGDNYSQTIFDQQANRHVLNGLAPFEGSFQSRKSLDLLNGMDPNGRWWLVVFDYADGDGGSLNGWSIEIATNSPSGWDSMESASAWYSMSGSDDDTPLGSNAGPGESALDIWRASDRQSQSSTFVGASVSLLTTKPMHDPEVSSRFVGHRMEGIGEGGTGLVDQLPLLDVAFLDEALLDAGF